MNRYSSVYSAVTIVQRFDDYNQFIYMAYLEQSSEEILSAAEEDGYGAPFVKKLLDINKRVFVAI